MYEGRSTLAAVRAFRHTALFRLLSSPHVAIAMLLICLVFWISHVLEYRRLADDRLFLLVEALKRIDCNLVDCSILP